MNFRITAISAIKLLVVLTLPLPAIAQTRSQKVTVNWGAEFKMDKRTAELGIVHSDASGTYNLMREGGLLSSSLYLQKFDKNLQLVRSEKQMYKQLDMPLNLQFMLPLGNELIAFTGKTDNKEDKNYLFYTRIDKTTLLESGFPEKVAEIDFKSGLFSSNAGSYEHRTSMDDSKLLIYYNRPYEKGRSEKFGFKVYDNKMHKLWERDVELPYNDELFSVERIRVGNNGYVYLIGKIYAEKKSSVKKGMPNYHLVILVYDKDHTEPVEYPVRLNDRFITDIQVTIGDNNDIICAGFYSEMGTRSIKGSFFLTVDAKTKQVAHQNYKDFPLDFITMGMKEKHEKKVEKKAEKGKNVELARYDLREIIQREDGGAVLIGEQYWVDVVTTTSTSPNGGTTSRTDYYYHYHDIIIINIGPDGEIEWNQKIPKRQVTKNDMGLFSSYAIKVMDEKLFFIFNDHPQNLYYRSGLPATFAANAKKMLPVLVEVDKAGNVEREALIGQDDTDLLIHPRSIAATGPREMIVYARRKKTHQLARVSFK